MWNIHPEKIMKMMTYMGDRHRGEMHSMYLDWQMLKFVHPHYEGVIEQPVPLVVIDFK